MVNRDKRSPLQIDVDVIGGGHGEWDLRVTLSPLRRGIRLRGVTVVLLDGSGGRLGATVVIPCSEVLDEVSEHEVRVSVGPGPTMKTVVARCQAIAEDHADPVVAERTLCGAASFTDYVSGASVVRRARAPQGQPLSPAEVARLQAAIAATRNNTTTALSEALKPAAKYRPPADADVAFKAFSQDFVDAFDLDPEDELTEELLKLIQES